MKSDKRELRKWRKILVAEMLQTEDTNSTQKNWTNRYLNGKIVCRWTEAEFELNTKGERKRRFHERTSKRMTCTAAQWIKHGIMITMTILKSRKCWSSPFVSSQKTCERRKELRSRRNSLRTWSYIVEYKWWFEESWSANDKNYFSAKSTEAFQASCKRNAVERTHARVDISLEGRTRLYDIY